MKTPSTKYLAMIQTQFQKLASTVFWRSVNAVNSAVIPRGFRSDSLLRKPALPSRLNWKRLAFLLLLAAVPASIVNEANAALPPLSPDELQRRAEVVVVGTVNEVTVTATQTKSQFSNWIVKIDATVERADKGSTAIQMGKTLRVECWSLKQRPYGWVGPSGHYNIPAKGARFRMWLTRNEAGNWSPLTPNGIILLDGHSRLDFKNPQRVSRKTEPALSGASIFRKLKFQLVNHDGDADVFIVEDDATPVGYQLRITNLSDQPITFPEVESPDDYHLSLSFRPETLMDVADRSRFAGTDQQKTVRNRDGSSSVLLTRPREWTIEPSGQKIVELKNLRFQAEGGNRRSRVELRLGTVYSGGNALKRRVRILPIQIVNHRGRDKVPLHIGLSSWKAGSCKIRIANVSRDHSISFDEANTRIVIDIDGDPAGGLEHLFEGIELVAKSDPTSTNVSVVKVGQDPTWVCTCRKAFSLQPADYLEFELRKPVLIPRNTLTKLRIDFENVPGYWDKEFDLEIPN